VRQDAAAASRLAASDLHEQDSALRKRLEVWRDRERDILFPHRESSGLRQASHQ
jgi:hypothetical protein